jgi:hypothetical protein
MLSCNRVWCVGWVSCCCLLLGQLQLGHAVESQADKFCQVTSEIRQRLGGLALCLCLTTLSLAEQQNMTTLHCTKLLRTLMPHTTAKQQLRTLAEGYPPILYYD